MRPTKKISSNADTPQRRMKEMKQRRLWVCALALMLMTTGCAGNYGGQMVGSAPILQAQRELPEDQLLDVGLVVFESEPITPQQAEKEGRDVYDYIREKDRQVPVLFISGNIEFLESIRQLKQKDPYIDHRSKPCRNVEYVRTINRLLDKKVVG